MDSTHIVITSSLLGCERGTKSCLMSCRGWSVPCPSRFTPRKDPVPIGSWVGPRAGLDGCGKSCLLPPGFNPRIVQPVASHCTNGIPAHTFCNISRNVVRRYKFCVVQHFKGVIWYKVNCLCEGYKFLGDPGLICGEALMTTAVLRNMLVRPHHSRRMILLLETHMYIGLKISHVIVYSPSYAPGRSMWHGSLGSQRKWLLRTLTVPSLCQNCPLSPMTIYIVWMYYDHPLSIPLAK
jgi:hypothetical protein